MSSDTKLAFKLTARRMHAPGGLHRRFTCALQRTQWVNYKLPDSCQIGSGPEGNATSGRSAALFALLGCETSSVCQRGSQCISSVGEIQALVCASDC